MLDLVDLRPCLAVDVVSGLAAGARAGASLGKSRSARAMVTSRSSAGNRGGKVAFE